ncbi:hypothetical protein C7M84_018098 [Penaeus vannamei]|uniref:Uncharacterized protein n=1 Tax=Penaeus vannamei TaxID=6689 RepID=A0A3R7PZ01_PENVA|nr:hypothetical protein C7M84_018098 [Penaeus vannamei]
MGVPLLLSARSLSQHDRKQGPLLRHAQGGDALRTPHHPRPGKRLALSRVEGAEQRAPSRQPRCTASCPARHARRPAGPEGGQLRPAPAPGGPGRAPVSSPAQHARQGVGRGPRVDLPPPRGRGPTSWMQPRTTARARKAPARPRGRARHSSLRPKVVPPYSCRRGPSAHTTAGRGRSAPGATEGSPSDGPGSQARASPCPRKTRQTGQTDRQPAAEAVPLSLSAQALSHTRPRPGPTPPPSAREGARGRWGEARANPWPAALGPRGRGGRRGREKPKPSPGQPRKTWLNGLAGQAARPPTPLARSGQAAARGKGPRGDARPPPPPHSRPRAALGSGGPRSHPRPLRHPRTPAPDRLSLQLAAQARSQHDQRQGLPSARRRHGGKDRAGDARPPPPPHSRPRAALGSGGPRSPPARSATREHPHPTASPYSWRRRPAANTTSDRAFHPRYVSRMQTVRYGTPDVVCSVSRKLVSKGRPPFKLRGGGPPPPLGGSGLAGRRLGLDPLRPSETAA